jgi:Nif-specific regulatory protein
LLVGPEPAEFVFDDDVVTIGRGEENMVVLTDPRVSALHGRLIQRDEAWFYEDLGSTNGSMVRDAQGKDVVVAPGTTPEVMVSPGWRILLGDATHPVRLDVVGQEARGERPAFGRAVRRRSMLEAGRLGTQLVQNPLTSRKVLHDLFEMFRDLAKVDARSETIELVLEFVMSHLDARLAAVYAGAERTGCIEMVRSRSAVPPRVPSPAGFRSLFSEVFDEQVSVVLTERTVLQNAFGSRGEAVVLSAMAAPLLVGGDLSGVLFLISDRVFTQFDLDLVTVVAHHTSACLHGVDLIGRLTEAEHRLRTENEYLRDVLDREEVSVEIIGESASIERALKELTIVAGTDTTVLLLGETGTGKELFAKFLHEAGSRRGAVFAAVNCGALVESLLESELFGHKKGAFTGAHADRKGLFEVADRGTLFLDEIGDISGAMQVKLLRVLENGVFTPVGSVTPVEVDVRILAATNKDLRREVEAGRFREDLFYRINVFPVELPPLRDRTGDVPILAEWFLARFNAKLGKQIAGFAPAALERLRGYEWPGNVRELQNEIERAVLLGDNGEDVQLEMLSDRISGLADLPTELGPLKEVMARLEERYVVRALGDNDGNRTRTAEALGISRQALTVKLNRYGLVKSRG